MIFENIKIFLNRQEKPIDKEEMDFLEHNLIRIDFPHSSSVTHWVEKKVMWKFPMNFLFLISFIDFSFVEFNSLSQISF